MAGEILASLEDINLHLPDDKAKISDADDDNLQTDVARYIRALLSGFFSSAILAGWSNPGNTPELIRGIAGRIIAAKWYSNLYSEDMTSVSDYAQSLYNEANAFIDQIRSGRMTVLDANEVPIALIGSIGLDTNMFVPNATTSDPKFSMDMILG